MPRLLVNPAEALDLRIGTINRASRDKQKVDETVEVIKRDLLSHRNGLTGPGFDGGQISPVVPVAERQPASEFVVDRSPFNFRGHHTFL